MPSTLTGLTSCSALQACESAYGTTCAKTLRCRQPGVSLVSGTKRVGTSLRTSSLPQASWTRALTIADVKLIRTDDGVLNATKFLVETTPSGMARAHFRDNTFNGLFVKEMIVIRAA